MQHFGENDDPIQNVPPRDEGSLCCTYELVSKRSEPHGQHFGEQFTKQDLCDLNLVAADSIASLMVLKTISTFSQVLVTKKKYMN